MENEIKILAFTAASIGFFHTILGPDHYLPFVMMAKAKKWTLLKTSIITFICGIGHVGSSVLLGLLGVAMGIGVQKLEIFESVRGSIAAWLLLISGFLYFVWGIKKAIRNKPHTHIHYHENDKAHLHMHSHKDEHMHIHGSEYKINGPFWILFTIFIFGPCEPLIPILMYPAAENSISGMLFITLIFSIFTILTMLTMVTSLYCGFSLIPLNKMERYMDSIAGASLFLCGGAIIFFGL